MLLCLLAQAGERHEAHRDMEGVERLRRAGILIGPRQPPQAEGVAARIAGVGVLQLLLARRLVQIEHAVSRGNVHAGLAQVFGKERAEKNDARSPTSTMGRWLMQVPWLDRRNLVSL